MAADRGAFIDQSQSFNVHMSDANSGKLTSMHFYAWKKGLKTGMYYLRSKAAVDAIKFTVDQQMLRAENEAKKTPMKARTPMKSPLKAAATPQKAAPITIQFGAAPGAPQQEKEEEKDIEAWRKEREKQREAMVCSLENGEGCISCS